ncbi:MAG: hypothetical protein M3296_09880 [Actinomycetota bacterium]|nr:hypothetical protein [Actinomycetota bacterium]
MTTPTPTSRRVLVPLLDVQAADGAHARRLRRYRMARVTTPIRRTPPGERFASPCPGCE